MNWIQIQYVYNADDHYEFIIKITKYIVIVISVIYLFLHLKDNNTDQRLLACIIFKRKVLRSDEGDLQLPAMSARH